MVSTIEPPRLGNFTDRAIGIRWERCGISTRSVVLFYTQAVTYGGSVRIGWPTSRSICWSNPITSARC